MRAVEARKHKMGEQEEDSRQEQHRRKDRSREVWINRPEPKQENVRQAGTKSHCYALGRQVLSPIAVSLQRNTWIEQEEQD